MTWINACVKRVLEITWENNTWWLMGLTRTWWHGYSWYLSHARIFILYNKIGCKNDKTDMELIWWKRRKCTLSTPTCVQGLVVYVITLCISLYDMGYWWAHYDYILIIRGMTSRWGIQMLFSLTVFKQR